MNANIRVPGPPGPQQGRPNMGGVGGGGMRLFRPVEKPKDAWGTIKRLLAFFKGQIPRIIIMALLLLVSASTAILAPFFMGRVIDDLNAGTASVVFESVIAALAGIYLCDAIAKFTQNFIVAGVSQRIVRTIRRELYGKIQKLPISFFDAYTHGELMSRLANDTDNIAGILGSAITQIISTAIILIGTLSMMLWLSPIMTLFSMIAIPFVFIITKSVAKKTRVMFKEVQANLGFMNAHIEETISGLQVVKAYSHEKYAVSDMNDINERQCKVATQAQIWSGTIMPVMNVINNLSFGIVAGSGGVLALQGAVTVGVIATFINYSRQFGRPLTDLAGTYNNILSALASAERVFEIMDKEPEPADPADAVTMDQPKGEILFDDVSFAYNPGEPVLKNVNFHVRAGQSVALVGPTGAGKTTIVNLVTRFYDVSSGSIAIDGVDIRQYTRDSLRRAFGIVLQDTYLFTGTIAANIRYGRQAATDSEVEEAAKAAGAHGFISRLPDGYQTILTESGQNLSQGQRQLLAIARAILSDPSILILDEATSSVDTRTELRIQEAFVRLMNGRTSFIIAHRLSTVVGADMIMVINHGQLEEWGSHQELLEKNGAYATMFQMQMAGVSIDTE